MFAGLSPLFHTRRVIRRYHWSGLNVGSSCRRACSSKHAPVELVYGPYDGPYWHFGLMGVLVHGPTASCLQFERQDLRVVDQMMQRLERSPGYDGYQSHMLFWTRAQCFRKICRAAEEVNYLYVSYEFLSAIMNHCHMASAL